jgi:hypothetical protein
MVAAVLERGERSCWDESKLCQAPAVRNPACHVCCLTSASDPAANAPAHSPDICSTFLCQPSGYRSAIARHWAGRKAFCNPRSPSVMAAHCSRHPPQPTVRFAPRCVRKPPSAKNICVRHRPRNTTSQLPPRGYPGDTPAAVFHPVRLLPTAHSPSTIHSTTPSPWASSRASTPWRLSAPRDGAQNNRSPSLCA